jgi:hypothetical protein
LRGSGRHLYGPRADTSGRKVRGHALGFLFRGCVNLGKARVAHFTGELALTVVNSELHGVFSNQAG